MGHESGIRHAGAVGRRPPSVLEQLRADVPIAERLRDEDVVTALEENQLSEVKILARRHTAVAMNTLVTICKARKNVTPAARVAAAKAILDYGHGKPGSLPAVPPGGAGADGQRIQVIIMKLADGTKEEINLDADYEVLEESPTVDGVEILKMGGDDQDAHSS